MHMADALLSPAVGGTMWAATAATIVVCSRRLAAERDDRRVPLMGVLGAFLFAAQMVNFAIPGTGSSGHLGGGLLLAILLGPHAAMLVMASVLIVQALFFADGGLLALGCNVFNLGFIPAFVAYPWVYRRIATAGAGRGRRAVAAVAAAIVGLQLGALGVVVETVASGISSLPLPTFLLFMQPIHLAIGVVEGLVTAAIVSIVAEARPDLLAPARPARPALRPVLAGTLAVALLTGTVLSSFASKSPDGLEWAIEHIAGASPTADASRVHAIASAVQQRTAVLPDYGLPAAPAASAAAPSEGPDATLGTAVSGFVGALATLGVALLVGLALRRRPAR